MSTTSIPANVPGSRGVTPNNRLSALRSASHDTIVPSTVPIAASDSVCMTIGACTSRADAPSAMRMPISCVRWLTEYEISP